MLLENGILFGAAIFFVGVLLTVFISKHRRKTSSISGAGHLVGRSESNSVFIGGDKSAPFLEVASLQTADCSSERRPLNLGQTKIDILTPLLQLIPTAAVGAEIAGKRYMQVVIDGTLAKSADGNGLRAFSRAGGKIKENARLFGPKKLQTLVGAAQVWQLASIIVAQKHLADIQESLDDIKEGVSSIEKFLVGERRSVLVGAVHYLDQAREVIQQGEFPEPVRFNLEAVERDLINAQNHIQSEICDLIDRTPMIKHSDSFGTGDFYKNIDKHQRKLEGLCEEWVMCARARIANWMVLAAFPHDEALKTIRRNSILKSFENFCEIGLSGDQASKSMNDKIGELRSLFNKSSTISSRKRTLEGQFQRVKDKVESELSDLEFFLETGSERLQSYQRPITLELEMVRDEIVSAMELAR
ncbi:MAG: hypothetical protein JJ855_04445 [Rhodospirillales bacterium]|nr:hypothetical protein [Rhodospirillales bacterium]